MIKISIVTICYNAATTIVPTLESVAAQSYANIEYLVIDGASRDNTVSLVRQICPQALIKSEPDRGLYDAMNKGICAATGDYLWFLNAGDTLREKDTVEKVVRAIEAATPCPDIVYGDTMIVDAEQRDLSLRRLRPPRHLEKKDFLRGMLVCHQAFVVSRQIVLPYNLRYKLSSDYDWCLQMLARSKSNLQIEAVLVNYLDGGLSKQKHWQSLCERFSVMRKHFGLLPTLASHISFLFVRKR